ncbi:hypothetical protein HS088_TW08G00463 [Tripterygium wilfordii]|uniref:Late embryogenesis abundant protein LEA-2 subgroup domain-containing protein n=1 Tax=Tripterygium wilfordii TaxID=458696 RepID=A0A7J7DBW1_TRIWF|nr:NDR1/HIN1-like protein 12 [Tripterygium wilfordii]KAF5743875.1 hypothetical protein HS088_TW08G00463 [Tripterygium wilfordii]
MAEEHHQPPPEEQHDHRPPEEQHDHPPPEQHDHQLPEEHHHQQPEENPNLVSSTTTHEKHFDHKGRANPLRALCALLSIFILLAGLTALTVWLVYRPQKPHFTVVAAAVYDLNVTSPPFISTSMQFTLVTRNPNKRVSIYYDKLTSYVSYKNQMITQPVLLPPLFHNKKSTVALSPVMGGPGVPVSSHVLNGLTMDEANGVVGLRVVIQGKLRWKAGAIKTGRYGVYVKCDVWVGLKRGFVGGQVPLLGTPLCTVDI